VAELTTARPDLPDELDDRAQDGWEPLFAIADLAGGTWPADARRAAVKLSTGRDVEDSLGHRLLVDCREAFGEDERLNTGELIDRLVEPLDAPWGDLYGKPITGRRVAALLRPYGIKPRHVMDFRGYIRADFEHAWVRYASSSVVSVLNGVVEPRTDDSEVSSAAASGHFEDSRNPAPRAKQDTSDSSQALPGVSDDFAMATDSASSDHLVAVAEVRRLAAKISGLIAPGGYAGIGRARWETFVLGCIADAQKGGADAEQAVERMRAVLAAAEESEL
jgi:hypothetical protein